LLFSPFVKVAVLSYIFSVIDPAFTAAVCVVAFASFCALIRRAAFAHDGLGLSDTAGTLLPLLPTIAALTVTAMLLTVASSDPAVTVAAAAMGALVRKLALIVTVALMIGSVCAKSSATGLLRWTDGKTIAFHMANNAVDNSYDDAQRKTDTPAQKINVTWLLERAYVALARAVRQRRWLATLLSVLVVATEAGSRMLLLMPRARLPLAVLSIITLLLTMPPRRAAASAFALLVGVVGSTSEASEGISYAQLIQAKNGSSDVAVLSPESAATLLLLVRLATVAALAFVLACATQRLGGGLLRALVRERATYRYVFHILKDVFASF